MGRKKGFDTRRIEAIIAYLAAHREGTWLRQIAKNLHMSPSTVARYADGVLKPLVEDISLTGEHKPLLRVLRLKPAVIDELQKGRNLQQILKILRIMENISG